jgi:hypothetical protein
MEPASPARAARVPETPDSHSEPVPNNNHAVNNVTRAVSVQLTCVYKI